MERVSNALKESWKQDHIAFVFEMVGCFFTIAASIVLAVTAKEPDMLTVYILYLIGSGVMCYAYIRRNMVWSIVLTVWFTFINIIGLIVVLS